MFLIWNRLAFSRIRIFPSMLQASLIFPFFLALRHSQRRCERVFVKSSLTKTGCVVSVVDGPGGGCMNVMPLLAVKTRRLLLYVASLIRICRVLSGSLGMRRCTRSISPTVNGGRSVELATRSVSCKTSSPSRSGIPEILREFLLEYSSRSSALSSRSSTFFVRSNICLSFAIIIVRSSATSCRSSSTRSSFSFLATLGSQRASKRSEVKFVGDAVDAPLDRLIALFGFDGARCRMLCLAQAWRDRRRGAGDNTAILGSVQMFLLFTLPTHSHQGTTTQLFLPQHHCHSVHGSPFCQNYLLSNVLTSEDHTAGHCHSPMVT